MKIITWNVNGLRAVHQKQALNAVINLTPDVICLQEIKAQKEQIAEELQELPGFVSHWNPAERPGYSGVLSYSRTTPVAIRYGLGIQKFDEEGRVIRYQFKNFFLYNIYFPNGQRGQERVDFKLEFYATLLEECNKIHNDGGAVIITGDFNTAHNEIDLKNPKENETTSGFLPEERVWVTKFLENGFKDAYRELYPDRVQYTWWTYRFKARERGIGWRLDYYLISSALMKKVKDVIIYEEITGSDHCPVMLEIED
jgi:exodeoxyribonuclease-3